MADLMDLLGRTHTLAILYAFSRNPGPWRFTELEKGLDLPPNTLTTRLKELVAAGLIDRQSYDEIPPRVEYTGTDRVEALKPAFTALYQWASSHGLDAGRTW